MATASAAGIVDVGRSRMRPCSSGCWHCRCRSVRSLDGAIRTLVPMRSRFRVGLVWVASSCRGPNAGDVWKLTCQKSVPARSCTRISTRRARSPAGDCRYSGVQLCHEFGINALNTKTGRSLRVHGDYRLDRCLVAKVCARTYVRSCTCIARTSVGDLRVSMRTRTATSNWIHVRVPSVVLARCPGAGAYRSAPSAPDGAQPGRIGAACGAADSCARSAAGCAQAPRRCRVVSAAWCLPRSSAASVLRIPLSAWTGVGSPAHSYGTFAHGTRARTHRCRRACGAAAAVIGRRRRLDHSAHGGARARGAQCAMRNAQVRTVAAAALGATHTRMHARAHTHTRARTRAHLRNRTHTHTYAHTD
jgi:hypothetical protein